MSLLLAGGCPSGTPDGGPTPEAEPAVEPDGTPAVEPDATPAVEPDGTPDVEPDAGPQDAGTPPDGGEGSDAGAGPEDAGEAVDGGGHDAGELFGDDAGLADGGRDAGEDGEEDAGIEDAGNEDAGIEDAGIEDAGAPAEDAGVDGGAFDAGVVDAGPPSACRAPPDDLVPPVLQQGGRFVYIDNFDMGEGLSDRALRVWLPASYADDADARYPVVYLHDGQNVFEASTAAFGVEWEADETADRLAAAGVIPEVILVGIDNTTDRMSDYTPDSDPTYGGGNGDVYVAAIANRVKPFIDATFRTECERDATTLLGSSLGGLISLRAAEIAADSFGRIGCLSSSFWWNNRSAIARFAASDAPLPLRLWIDGGNAEGALSAAGLSSTIENNRHVLSIAQSRGAIFGSTVAGLEVEDGQHNEAAWRDRLGSVLGWLLTDVAVADDTMDVAEIHLATPRIDVGQQTAAFFHATYFTASDPLRISWPPRLDATGPARLDATNGRGVLVGESEGAARLIFGPPTEALAAAVVQVGLEGQVALLFSVQAPPAASPVVVVGNDNALGAWEPSDGLSESENPGRSLALTLVPANTTILYKYTLGSWETVEKGPNGEELGDRQTFADGPKVLRDVVQTWADAP